jgi:hypothetical protein
MWRNQILAITFCSFACVGYANTSAYAGWFGPSDYNECMLQKMKGQPEYMLDIAATACAYQFACNDKFKAEFGQCVDGLPAPGAVYCMREAFHYCNDH